MTRPTTPSGQEAIDKVAALAGWHHFDEWRGELETLIAQAESEARSEDQALRSTMADGLAGTIDGSGMYVQGYAAGLAEARQPLQVTLARLHREMADCAKKLRRIATREKDSTIAVNLIGWAEHLEAALSDTADSEQWLADDHSLDGTDGAHPAWWRGDDHGYQKGFAQAVDRVVAALTERWSEVGQGDGWDFERVIEIVAQVWPTQEQEKT